MTKKRFFLMRKFLRKDKFHDIICHKIMDSKETEKTLNILYDKYSSLKIENEQLKREKERYKRLSEIRDENINNRILTLKEFITNCEDEKVKNILEDFFYSEVKEYDLAKENRKLKEENKQLKKENQKLRYFKLSIKAFAECNDNINRRTLNDLIGEIDYD